LCSFWAFWKLGLFWVCIGFVLGVCEGIHFRNPFPILCLRSFAFFGNWVCFGKKGLFFVVGFSWFVVCSPLFVADCSFLSVYGSLLLPAGVAAPNTAGIITYFGWFFN
jgi:hypothetical protein